MESDFYCENVLSKKIPIKIVIETENVLAFHHTKPSFPVHIVVIPKFHTLDFLSLIDGKNEIILEMMEVLQHVIKEVREQYGGCRLTTNFGKYQVTKHLHWHVYISDDSIN